MAGTVTGVDQNGLAVGDDSANVGLGAIGIAIARKNPHIIGHLNELIRHECLLDQADILAQTQRNLKIRVPPMAGDSIW
jgi:hypothetical protein